MSRTKKTLYFFLVPTLAVKGLARDTTKCVIQSSISHCVPKFLGPWTAFLSTSECWADTAGSPKDPKDFSLILSSAAAESNSRLQKPATPTGGVLTGGL